MKKKLTVLLLSVIFLLTSCGFNGVIKDDSTFTKQIQEKSMSRGMPSYGMPPYGYRGPYNPYYPPPSPDDEQMVRQYEGKTYFFGKHFTSWAKWSRYLIARPNMTRYGKYFYDGTQMMFRFCDPDSNQCFFFIIDR